MIKRIPEYPNYFVDEYGNVYSNIKGIIKKKKPWLDGKRRYYMIGLSKNGRVKKFLIHRLVAEAFVENLENKPCVNHKDNNPKNNYYKNLEWCTQKENIHYSYSTMNQYRNQRPVVLYYDNNYIDSFPNIKTACEYASNTYPKVSKTGLSRNLKSGKAFIKKV